MSFSKLIVLTLIANEMQALWKAELDRREVENGDFHRGLDNPVPRKRKSKGYRG